MKRGFLVLAVVLAVLVSLLALVTWIPLRRAREAWRGGRVAEAVAQATSWSRLRVWPNQYRQMLAAAYLTVGNRGAAKEHLDALRGKKLWISTVPKVEVAQRLFARGRQQDYLEYDGAVRTWFESDDADLYRAAALIGANRPAEAQPILREIDRGDVDAQKLAALERALVQRSEGHFPYALDRDGQTIASYQVANKDVVAVNSDFGPLVERSAGELTIEAYAQRSGATDTLELTLDSAVQKAAIRALGGFKGALVAIDPRTHEILAIASTGAENRALETQYEPGSVIKVLTVMSALSNHVELQFPYTCNGDLLIDGRHFGDWLEGGHGVLPDLDQAMARSCNVVFADLGVRLGRDRLKALFNEAGFDGQVNLDLVTAPLGHTVGNIFNNFETAFYAIGLEHATTTTLHGAMLAEMAANRGMMSRPLLIRARRSILGERLVAPNLPSSRRIVPQDVAERVAQLMVAVVKRPQGTGRRAAIDNVSLALKTGTAGKREDGYHALVLGFAPVEQPKIAFALVAESSGPAEFAAAKIAHDFLAGIEDRLR